MFSNLNSYLEQISLLISGMKDKDIDLEKLVELDKSLDLLSHQIKATRLDISPGEHKPHEQDIRQDAVFFIDQDYRVIRFVGSFENIFGRHRPDNLPHMHSLLEDEDFLQFKTHTELLWETTEPQSFNSRIISQNGILLPVNFLLEEVHFAGHQKMVSAGMVFYKETPSDLNDYREILIENLPGMDVFLFDLQFRHVLAGGREKKRLGLTNADFSGKTLFEIYDEKSQKRLFPFYRNALDGKVSEGEVRFGDEVFFVSATPVFGLDNQVVGGALISQNVTREKEIERSLIKAKREAEEADKAKSLFLANMSHEIRTPLNAIIGFADLMKKTQLTPNQERFIRLIGQSSEHLLSVVNEVLFLFKLGMGKVNIERVSFNLRELVENVKESLNFRAMEKKLSFKCVFRGEVPEIVTGDPFRVKQILINLTGNAIKYTDQGEVTVYVTCESATSGEDYIRFVVADTGIGIPKEDLDVIFDEFAQPVVSKEKMRKGAGLGLTIVHKLVGLLNGRLHVESEPGRGSEFTVVIPFGKPGKFNVPEKEKEYIVDGHSLEGKRILYVDDDENNLLLGESIFTGWNVLYEIACNGEEALQWLEKEKFDMVLLDIQMPGISGVDVIKRVRREEENPNRNTKILAVTANIMKDDLKKYMDSGFDDYILKPFREEGLFNKICNLLDVVSPVRVDSLSHSGRKDQAAGKTDKVAGEMPFDTSTLEKMTGNDTAYFNRMIDTFLKNARETADLLVRLSEEEEWESVARTAHKAIPSFRFFKLTGIVNLLTRLETQGLYEKKYAPMALLASQTALAIKEIIEKIQKTKIPLEDS